MIQDNRISERSACEDPYRYGAETQDQTSDSVQCVFARTDRCVTHMTHCSFQDKTFLFYLILFYFVCMCVACVPVCVHVHSQEGLACMCVHIMSKLEVVVCIFLSSSPLRTILFKWSLSQNLELVNSSLSGQPAFSGHACLCLPSPGITNSCYTNLTF